MSEQWYTRLADVPAVDYQGSPEIQRSKLPGADERPEVHRFTEIEPTLWWGNTSASPARRHGLESPIPRQTAAAIRQLAETLELPGTVSDYHFVIQQTVGALWSQRRAEPEMLEQIESLSWLDVRLVQSYPGEFLVSQTDNDHRYYEVTAFNTLRGMYEREGLLRQALEVERIAARFGQSHALEELEAKVALLDSESQR